MLLRKVLALLFISKMAVSQSLYPTTAVSYSTNAVPTIQTLPVSPTLSSVPATVTNVPMPTQPATFSTMPVSPITSSSGVKVTTMPASTLSSMSPSLSSMSSVSSPSTSPASKITEPKARFLPASIPDPKVTILPHDTPTTRDISCLNDPYLLNIKNNGSPSPVKRITMACTDDFILPDEDPLCLGITKNNFKPPTPLSKKGNKGNLNNPIDFEGLMDGFMSCL
ncbi:mucin-2-like [Cydia pomonella]|uniref:mucin-2-like n=1 Tax=Cydia pomonella TaxID=82600 RepID=UPI002ADE4E70|nr:mucin-2-like [Cydia pomonella]